MKRIFNDFAYGSGPRDGCWWDETCDMPELPRLDGHKTVDVAIIGGGYTGVSAALSLARQGVSVAVLEARGFGWGASGRSGGFCCLGGGRIDDAAMDRTYGRAGRLAFRQAEKHAVAHVENLIEQHGIEVDRHSEGETELAHRAKDVASLLGRMDAIVENYGVTPQFTEKRDLAARGLGGGFFGALTIPLGFGLNPRKYLAGLVRVARAAGAALFADSEVLSLRHGAGARQLVTHGGTVTADHVIVATNGYSSEDLAPWLGGRFMPAQSTILVTRPLTDAELQAQGWTSGQMCYDTRKLLHYFRLMPDRRFLFGMRGGLFSGARAEEAGRRLLRAEFERMFPHWTHVPSAHRWSGLVSLARNRLPFVGAIPGEAGLWTAMCFHGNGVAMGTYAGKMVADLLTGKDASHYPAVMQRPLAAFPFGTARRILMPPLYAALKLRDNL